jgi:argininosuccinate synthase
MCKQVALILSRIGSLVSRAEGNFCSMSQEILNNTLRRCYETPGGTILRAAHVDLEGLTLDREVRRLRDEFSQKLSEILYNGFWFSAEREFIMAAVAQSQKCVRGSVHCASYFYSSYKNTHTTTL